MSNRKEIGKTEHINFQILSLTLASLKGQNLGFPLRPYLSNCVPFLRAVMACHKEQGNNLNQNKLTEFAN
jgi:hypothetical protein